MFCFTDSASFIFRRVFSEFFYSFFMLYFNPSILWGTGIPRNSFVHKIAHSPFFGPDSFDEITLTLDPLHGKKIHTQHIVSRVLVQKCTRHPQPEVKNSALKYHTVIAPNICRYRKKSWPSLS